MARVKTSELIGAALDWAVAKCEGVTLEHGLTDDERYSTEWAQGGPIIEREGISLRPIRKEGHALHDQCLAAYDQGNTDTMVRWVKRADWPRHYHSGPTTLVAAMRCFVASRLGDEVEIPEGLLP